MEEMFTQNDFSGGYNDTTPPDNMLNSELRKCDNAHVPLSGGFEKRPGCEKVNAISYNGDITQEIEWLFGDGTVQQFRIINNKLHWCNPADNTLAEKIVLQRDYIGYALYKDKMYFVDGSKYYVYGEFDFYSSSGSKDILVGHIVKNFPRSTHATNPGIENHFYKAKVSQAALDLAAADYGDVAKWDDITIGSMCDNVKEVVPDTDPTCKLDPIKRCKYLALHPLSLRLFAAGDHQNPTALYYAEPDKPNFFKETSVVYPTTANGPITGMIPLNKSMLIGYQETWRVWNGTQVGIDAEWKPLSIPYGLIAHDTIVLTPESMTYQASNGHIYVINPAILADEDAIKVMDKDMIVNLTQNKINNTIKSMVNKNKNKAVFYDDKYLLAYCDDAAIGYNNKVLELNWQTKSFTRITGWHVNCWCRHTSGDLTFGSRNYSLKAYKGYNDINVDTGEAQGVNMDVITKPYSCNTFLNKIVDFIFITAQQYTLLTDVSQLFIDIVSDYISTTIGTDLNESLIWGRSYGKLWGFSEIVNQWAELHKEGRRFQFAFRDNSLDNPIFIYMLGLGYDVLDSFPNAPMSQEALISKSV